jgi:hypothetical protein
MTDQLPVPSTVEVPASELAKSLAQLSVSVLQKGRCQMCWQREGTPPDCTPGRRFVVNFGVHGGLILCEEALTKLVQLSDKHLEGQ